MKKTDIQSHAYEPTDDRNIFRFVDREGNWTHYWIKKQKVFAPAVNHIIRTGYPKGERFYSYLLNATAFEAEKKLKTAGEEGARTHAAIRDLIAGQTVTQETTYFNELTGRYEPLSTEEWLNLESFYVWCEEFQPRVIDFEHAVWSALYNYAGTVDFVGIIHVPIGSRHFPKETWDTHVLILLDWKTSSGIWDEYELQIAAYRKAVLETKGDKMPTGEYGGMWTGIIRLGTGHKSGYEMKVWNVVESEDNFAVFTSVQEIYYKKEGRIFEPKVWSIPSELQITMPRLRRRRKKKVSSDVHVKRSRKNQTK